MTWELLIPVALALLVGWVTVRQRRVYLRYEAAQQQVLARQAEALEVQREALQVQKEMVRLLGAIASGREEQRS